MSDPVKYNNAFFEQLSRSPKVDAICRGVAVTVAAIARASAPVDSRAYKNGITVRRKFQKRVVWLVVGADKKTMLIESKTGNLVRALNTAKRRGRG